MKQTLFLMLGYPGAGKTTAAKVIEELTGAVNFWADHVRRQMFQHPTYSHLENIQLYEHLNNLVNKTLSTGENVIFDTNFNFYKDRNNLRKIAEKHGAETLIVWVKTQKELAKQRAVVDAHKHQHTRVLGHMPESHFERITGNLEPPHDDEPHIQLDGTKIDTEYVRSKLAEAGLEF